MKKIGIVTINSRWYAYNHGGQLQCFALSRYLEQHGYRPKVILNTNYGRRHCLFTTIINEMQYHLKAFACRFFKQYRRQRVCSFERFGKKYIKKSFIPFYKGMNYQNLNNKFDFFVAGSDQVWNPNYYDNLYINFLKFAPNEKRVAYAPSIGVSELTPLQKKDFKDYLVDFDKISCREQGGAEILAEIISRHVPVVLDPTMLFNADDWAKIENRPKFHIKDKYLLLYFLGNITEDYKNYIKRISQDYKLRIVNLNDINSVYFSCGPAEFLYLIHFFDYERF